jgi:hypothetical protein
MEDVIISQERTLTTIVLEGKYSYAAYITIGLVKSGHFRVFIEFDNVDLATLKELHRLYLPVKALKIKCRIFTQENYNISHIIVEKFKTDRQRMSITWQCIADDPVCSLL